MIRFASRTLAVGLLSLLALAAVPGAARAQAARAKVEALVASVSTSGAQIDPALSQMAKDFKANGLAFTSYKLMGRSRLDLAPGQSQAVALPSGQATVTFLRQEADGKLRFKVAAPGSSSEVSMGPRGEVYLDAGSHGGGKLFLVLKR